VYETAQAAFPRFENLSAKPSASRSSERSSFETENTFAYWAQESLAAIVCGGVAGCAFWLTMLPVDYAKTRLQIASRGGADDVGAFSVDRQDF
jgi:hypothetical protein